jgi:hypothetical protein
MGSSKWEGAVAVARSTSASHEPTSTAYKYPDAESVDIQFVPITYERAPSFSPDVDTIIPAGFEGRFAIGNVRPNCNLFGYLMALSLGTTTWGTGTATATGAILPSNDLSFFNVLANRIQQIGTATTIVTQRAVGCKVSEWTLEQSSNQLAALSLSGPFCNLGTPTTALTPSVPTGTNEAPLSWASLRAGTFVVGIGTGALAQDNEITGFRLGCVRGSTPTGRGNLGSNQPSDHRPGKRILTLDIMKEFSGTNAKAQYDAFIAQSIVKVQLKYLVGSYLVQSGTMVGQVIDNFPGPIGAQEDIIQAGLKLKLYKDGSANLIDWTLVDGSTAVYW